MIRRPPRSKRPDTRFPYTTRFRSQCHERADINIQNVHGRGLENDLELVIMLQAIRVLAVSAILGTTGWLHIGGAPRLGTDRAQKRGGVRCSRADLHVIGLQKSATVFVPVLLER